LTDRFSVLVTALAISALLAPVARSAGARVGLVDRPSGSGPLKIHARAIPVVGGILTVTSAFLSLIAFGEPVAAGVVAGSCVALMAGLVDDVRSLTVWPRLAFLGVAGVVVSIPLLSEWHLLAAVGIVVLTMCTANGVNILDGQDGLAGGLVVSAALGLSLSLPHDETRTMLLGFAVAGATLGFLLWNRPPARLFLGNNGAYALGTLLTVLCAVLIESRGWQGVLAGGTCLMVFAFEVVSTLFRRWRTRRSLTGGDRSHSYDLLASRLGSRERATSVFLAIGLVAAGTGLLIAYAPAVLAVALFLAVMVLALGAARYLWST
jgi:UDP-GlcNAc:undecaprenyl-phosphate/decaprenyl-phosphate GlcNAc-1-phosphate transferase